MSLYKRGGIWHYDFSLAGQRYRGSTNAPALACARKIEALKIAEARERGGSPLPRRAPILSDFASRFLQWVESSQLEPKTKLYYQNGWRMIRETPLTGLRLDRITTDEAEVVRFPGSPQNANRAFRTLRRMLGKAAEWGVIRVAPRIKLVKEYGRSMLIDRETEAKLLAVASQPLRDVLIIILDTGMRPQETFQIRWENVNWESRTIFVPFGKTRNSRRYVPMSQRVVEALFRRCMGQKEGWMFPSTSRKGHLTTVAKAFSAARKKAGVSPDIVLYSARHTFATRVLDATGNLAVLMKAMGHASAQTAMIYQHPGLDSIRRAVDESNLVLAGTSQIRHSSKLIQ